MATWVEDIVQALKNLGGQATLAQIYEEVKNTRTEPLPNTYKASIRERIEAHSSDSSNFNGKDHFRKVDRGVWALRELLGDQPVMIPAIKQDTSEQVSIGNGGDELTATWLEDIVQALKNLGGQGTQNQILAEVKRIRTPPLPQLWKYIIQTYILSHSSDSKTYDGKKPDLFVHMDSGVWALRVNAVVNPPTRPVIKQSKFIPPNYQTPESFEEIANILQTIKQYRDYRYPDSPSWREYVDEVFHILGFSTDEKNPRLIILNVMGSNHTPKAIVGFVRPGENFEELVPGLSWESYLFFAANYFQVDWGILTDGIQLRIVNFKNQEIKQAAYWSSFDGVVCNEELDTFCTIYKILSYIKWDGVQLEEVQKKRQKSKHGHNLEDLADRYVLRLEFWGQLLEKAKLRTKLHRNISPRKENWSSTGAGKAGLSFTYVVRMNDAQVEFYIDNGKAEWNKMVFNTLMQHQTEIDLIFGEPLDWQLLPDKRASRICFVISKYGLEDQGHWDELQDELIDAMIRLEKALSPYIHRIN